MRESTHSARRITLQWLQTHSTVDLDQLRERDAIVELARNAEALLAMFEHGSRMLREASAWPDEWPTSALRSICVGLDRQCGWLERQAAKDPSDEYRAHGLVLMRELLRDVRELCDSIDARH